MDITTATPVEIDTVLAEIWNRIDAVESQIEAAKKKARDAHKAVRQGYKWYQEVADEAEARIPTLREQLVPLEAEVAPYEAEFIRRGGWTRAFLVTNNNGHVHKDRNCSTCRISTRYAWMIDYSGKNEEEIVADAGCLACTVCFPSAPLEGLAMPTKMFATPEDAAKAAKKAAAPADCAGSGTWDYPADTARKGYYSGNYGVCSHCNEAITISSTGKMRKHKAK
jgi:hypothetical protein